MKVLPFGVAVLEGDTHISKWVEQHGTIEIAKDWPIGLYKHLISEGGVVVDAGAFIGDHTVTYAKLVGTSGRVYAFEPNTAAYACLVHNTKDLPQVVTNGDGLGYDFANVEVVGNPNAGASHVAVVRERTERSCYVVALDSIASSWSRLDFIKMDIEGFEVGALNGARETIRRFRPAMFIEVNEAALKRAGTSRDALLSVVGELGYNFEIVPPDAKITDPQYDILCAYRK